MRYKKRLTAIVLILAVAAITVGIALSGAEIRQPAEIEEEEEEQPLFTSDKDTLYLWYADEALQEYVSSAAVAYGETHEVRIVPVLTSGLEYLEAINKASVQGEEVPDLFVVSHDSLEKAYLAGLAVEIKTPEGVEPENQYIRTGLLAATYKDKLVGYPFYYETSALLYNKTYLKEMAKNQIIAQMAAEAAEAEMEAAENGVGNGSTDTGTAGNASTGTAGNASTGTAENTTGNGEAAAEENKEPEIGEALLEEKVEEILPTTIDEMRNFADDYDAPEQVESVFKWDVTDIFYNYFFIGDAIDMGGEAGWDTSRVNIYNSRAVRSMKIYEELNQFFSIDTSEISYKSVLNEFMEGKLVFTVATTDAVDILNQAADEGTFLYEYGVSKTPDVDHNMPARPLSVTQCVAINGYGRHQKEANEFAAFLTGEYKDILYARTGKVSAAANVEYEDTALQAFAGEYACSVPMPKMMATSNFWIQLEATFAECWNGADADTKLRELSEQMQKQIDAK